MITKSKTYRIALVTQAECGPGREVAEQLAKAGLHVIIGGCDPKAIRHVVSDIRENGGEANALVLDISNPDSIQRAARAVDSYYGRLDVLVDTSGCMNEATEVAETLIPVSSKIVYENFESNFFGVLALTQAFWPSLEKSQRATIVNMSSLLQKLKPV